MTKIWIISVTLLLLLSLLLVSCGKPKAVLSAEEFQSQMQEAGYKVIDASEQFPGDDAYESVLVAINEEDNYQIEFYVVLTEAQTIQAFNNVKNNFESEKGRSSSYSAVSISNHNKYTQTTNGKYYVVSRIGNTFLYVVTISENKDAVNNTLKALDY